jgi:hypothetical protein
VQGTQRPTSEADFGASGANFRRFSSTFNSHVTFIGRPALVSTESLQKTLSGGNPINLHHRARLLLFGILSMALTAAGQVSTPVPYSISTFATGVANVYFQPDSIALLNGRIFNWLREWRRAGWI